MYGKKSVSFTSRMGRTNLSLGTVVCLGLTLSLSLSTVIGIASVRLAGHVLDIPLKTKWNEIMSNSLFTAEILCLKFDFFKKYGCPWSNCTHCMTSGL